MRLDFTSHEESAFQSESCQEEVDKVTNLSVFISRLVEKFFCWSIDDNTWHLIVNQESFSKSLPLVWEHL